MVLTMLLEPRALTHFVAVAEHKSFRKAAQAINLSQPALSSSVHQLEEELGVKLFERGAHGVELTLFGEALLARAELIRAELGGAVDEINELRGAQKGKLKIGAGPSVMSTLIPNTVLKLLKKRPGIEVSIMEGLREPILNAVRSGKIEFAVSTTNRNDVELSFIPLYITPVVPMARAGHPLAASSGKKDPNLLSQFPWILPDSSIEPESFETILNSWNIEPPSTIIRSNSPTFMKSIVELSDFIVIAPASMLDLELKNGAISLLRLGRAFYQRELGIVLRKHSMLSPVGKLFVEEIKHMVKQLKLHLPVIPSP